MKIFIKKRSLITFLTVVIFLPALLAQPLEDFLQADFEFENGSLMDGSPNMLDGTGFDLTTVYGWDQAANSALSFNGNSSYILCSTDDRNITDQLTVSAWFRTTTPDRQIIASKYNHNEDRGYFIGILNGYATLEGRDGTTNFHRITTEGVRMDDGRWHHLVGVIDKNIWKLYVDCQLYGTLDTGNDTPQFSISDQLTIGRLAVQSGTGLYRYFSGEIDDFQLYNHPATEAEVLELSGNFCQDQEQLNLLEGLVAYYPFNGDALDHSGNGLHGTVNGATSEPDRFDLNDSALRFDGTDDYVQINDHPLLDFGTWPFAISVWAKATNPEGGPQMIVHKGISGSGGNYWFRENGFEEDIRMRGVVTEGNPPATDIVVTEPIFNDLEWHHIVFQRTSTAIEFWVDGELAIQLSDTQFRNVDSEGNLMIGAQNPWLPGGNYPYIHHHFAGFLDEVRLYNRSLSTTEILAVSNTYCPNDLVIDTDPVYNLYQADQILSTTGEVNVNSAVVFKAGNAIELTPGFHVQPGSRFSAIIEDCLPAIPEVSQHTPMAEDLFVAPAFERHKLLSVDIAPNPVQSNMIISIQMAEDAVTDLRLLDLTGRPVRDVFTGRKLESGFHQIEEDLSDLTPGVYFLFFQTGVDFLTKKIIKN